MRWYKHIIIPAGLLAALIIGAGMFSLPFVFQKAGWLPGFFYLAAFSLIFSLIHLMYLAIIQQTGGHHRFVGYAKIHLGRFGFLSSILVTVFTLILVLTIYLILSASFIRLILPDLNSLVGVLAFWFLGTTAVILGIKKMAGIEFWTAFAMVALVLVIFIGALNLTGFSLKDVSAFNLPFWFLPFGPVLFSLAGRAGISSIYEYFKVNKLKERGNIELAIILGTIIPAIIYLFFVFGVLSFSPGLVTPDAVSGMIMAPIGIIKAIGILGILSLLTSYVFLGLELKGIFRLDFELSEISAALLVILAPIGLYLLGVADFIKTVSLAGGVFAGLEGVLVVLMYEKISGRRVFIYLLLPVFFLGALYEVLQMF